MVIDTQTETGVNLEKDETYNTSFNTEGYSDNGSLTVVDIDSSNNTTLNDITTSWGDNYTDVTISKSETWSKTRTITTKNSDDVQIEDYDETFSVTCVDISTFEDSTEIKYNNTEAVTAICEFTDYLIIGTINGKIKRLNKSDLSLVEEVQFSENSNENESDRKIHRIVTNGTYACSIDHGYNVHVFSTTDISSVNAYKDYESDYGSLPQSVDMDGEYIFIGDSYGYVMKFNMSLSRYWISNSVGQNVCGCHIWGTRILAGDSNNRLTALDYSDGSELWYADSPAGVTGIEDVTKSDDFNCFTVHPNRYNDSEDGELYVYEYDNDNWSQIASGGYAFSCITSDGSYIYDGNIGGEIECLNDDSFYGQQWRDTTLHGDSEVHDLSVDSDYLYSAGGDGYVLKINKSDGSIATTSTTYNVAEFDFTYELNMRIVHVNWSEGNDTNSGARWSSAWLTLSKGANETLDGEKLQIASGDYREQSDTVPQISPINVGTSGITYQILDYNSKGYIKFWCGIAKEHKRILFNYDNWGSKVEYFYDYDSSHNGMNWINGYRSDYCNFVSSDIHLNSGNLAWIYIDDEYDSLQLYTGSDIILEDGWSIHIESVDSNGDTVLLQVNKDGSLVEEHIIADNENMIQTQSMNNEDFPIIVMYVSAVFRGSESNGIQIEGLWQVSDWYISDTGVDTSYG